MWTATEQHDGMYAYPRATREPYNPYSDEFLNSLFRGLPNNLATEDVELAFAQARYSTLSETAMRTGAIPSTAFLMHVDRRGAIRIASHMTSSEAATAVGLAAWRHRSC